MNELLFHTNHSTCRDCRLMAQGFSVRCDVQFRLMMGNDPALTREWKRRAEEWATRYGRCECCA